MKHTAGKVELGINKIEPRIMHIDLNSCFATIEQQAKRHWRGQPVGVVAYDSPGGIILAASYEAKRLGIKLGTRVWEAQKISPGIHICCVDPPKYREAHRLFREVLENYTNNIKARSIDEFVLDLSDSKAIRDGKTMQQIGYEIKQEVYRHVGEAVSCNVGIGPNRFLAKLASGLNKPNGLDTIDSNNMDEIYARLDLQDLPGINRRYDARLRIGGIGTVTSMFEADAQQLRGIFGGIVGYYWWLRLRGWEIDDRDWKTGSQIGHQYAMKEKLPHDQLDPIIFKLSQKIARRLSNKDLKAVGIRVGLRYVRSPYWHKSTHLSHQLITTQDIFRAARDLIDIHAPKNAGLVSLLSVTTFDFQSVDPEQLAFNMTDRPLVNRSAISKAMNIVNSRYGDFALIPATMIGTDDIAGDSIAFGNLS
ncbi:MAG: hypothetical protein Q7T74_04720 [Candidatus Saccharibacteria bacterium]|nr:hypothetical protein [Candidatus Saccharibacteria bacterium]